MRARKITDGDNLNLSGDWQAVCLDVKMEPDNPIVVGDGKARCFMVVPEYSLPELENLDGAGLQAALERHAGFLHSFKSLDGGRLLPAVSLVGEGGMKKELFMERGVLSREDGEPSEIWYHSDGQVGYEAYTDASGRLHREDSPAILWHDRGRTLGHETYRHGELQASVFFPPKGSPGDLTEAIYQDGKLVKTTETKNGVATVFPAPGQTERRSPAENLEKAESLPMPASTNLDDLADALAAVL